MNKKSLLIITLMCVLSISVSTYFNFSVNNAYAAAVTNVEKTTNKVQVDKSIINTTSLNIVNNPNKYLNKTVKMQATFDKFSTLGLDYSKAMRPSSKYIGILIQRDDVADHNIPLSEMKMFLEKSKAEKYIDLDVGDKIQITAKVFSTALNDPWLDIDDISIIKKQTSK